MVTEIINAISDLLKFVGADRAFVLMIIGGVLWYLEKAGKGHVKRCADALLTIATALCHIAKGLGFPIEESDKVVAPKEATDEKLIKKLLKKYLNGKKDE